VANILQVMPVKAQHVVGMLINLKIVKRYDEQISFRKKVLKQWLQLNLDEQSPVENPKLDQVISQLKAEEAPVESEILKSPIQSAQQDLFKNFGRSIRYNWKWRVNCVNCRAINPKTFMSCVIYWNSYFQNRTSACC